MAKSNGLTKTQRTHLKTLDTLLSSLVPRSHVIVAALIVQHWSEEHDAFQGQLIMRAERWRRQHIDLKHQWKKSEDGIFGDLMRILEDPGDIEPGVRGPMKRRTKRIPLPSLNPKTPDRLISNDETENFMKMITKDGICDVFDPGNHILDNTVFRPPLILLGDKAVFFEDVWPIYRDATIDQPWDPEDRAPEIAFAIDYVLLIIQHEKKWTWPIADRYMIRLPWGHPWKATHQGRPGWDASIRIMSENGMIEKHHGQTWICSEKINSSVSAAVKKIWTSTENMR